MKTEISKFSPCEEAVYFRANYKTFEDAWQNCPRGDWMLWIAKRVGVDLQTLTLAKALCAKTVLHLMKDERSRKAVEVAEKFGKGEATREELDSAAAAAAAAYDAAYAAHAYAYAAAAAAAGVAAAYDAAYAAYAAHAYAYAAAAAGVAAAYAHAYADAKKANQQQTADICREILTTAVMALIHKP